MQRLSFVFSFLFNLAAFGQITIQGTIIDKMSRVPIPYANIGIPDKAIGTVTSSDGTFYLMIPHANSNDQISIKQLGYRDTTIRIQELAHTASFIQIELNPKVIELKEFAVNASASTVQGHQPNGEQVKGFFKASGLGMEAGTLIKNKDTRLLNEFNMNVLKITFDSLKFRINIYSVDGKRVLEKLNTRNLNFTLTSSDTGIYKLALTQEKIEVKGDYLCSIELIDVFGKNASEAELLFSALKEKGGIIYKKSMSLDKWVLVKDFSLCFWLR